MTASQIVVINVSQTQAPSPAGLQNSGAFVSQGGTTTLAGVQSLVTQLADLTAILSPALALSNISWASSLVTAVTAAPHGIPNGTQFWVVIAGVAPAGYNGLYLATVTTGSHLTYALVSNPGTVTAEGTYQNATAAELLEMGTTFFANGSGQSVYVNELGVGSPAQGVTALGAWIAANPGVYYSYLVPREWGGESTFVTLANTFTATNAKTYFFTTMTNGNYASFADLKCVVGEIESPGVGATEFSLAAAFYKTLSYRPSNTNRVTPLAFSFQFGVTEYPAAGNNALFTAWKAAGVNWIGDGAEGGISDTILFFGTTMDGRPWNYWYSADWGAINLQRDIANAVINGSNDSAAPLYLDQPGINTLEAVGARTLRNGASFGLVLGTVVQTELDGQAFQTNVENGVYAGQAVINAVPFTTYYDANPGDFKVGIYAGFAAAYAPLRGFEQIIFNLNITDFVG